MSLIKNDSFEPGKTILSSEVNAKFTDAETATADLDATNVRNEGIDRKNIDDAGILRHWYQTANGVTTSTNYVLREGRNAFYLAHGTGMEISFGAGGIAVGDDEMLRLHYSVVLEKIDNYTWAPGPTNEFVTFFPVWDITSNALANYETLPDHMDLLTDRGAGDIFMPVVPSGADENQTDGYIVLQAYGNDDGAGAYWIVRTGHGSWTWLNETGSSQTIYGIKIYGRGLLTLNYNTGTSEQSWYYSTTAGDTEDIHVERAQATAMVLRKGIV